MTTGPHLFITTQGITANLSTWFMLEEGLSFAQGSEGPGNTFLGEPPAQDTIVRLTPTHAAWHSHTATKPMTTARTEMLVVDEECQARTLPLPDARRLLLDEHDLGERDGHAALLRGDGQKARITARITARGGRPVSRHFPRCRELHATYS